MTYNVHRCLGCDGKFSPRRIARVIAQFHPDVVALQELDVGHARSGYHDQPALLSELLKMPFFFHPAIAALHERYGDALFSPHPMRLVRAGSLPGSPGLEPRGALWAEVEVHGHKFQVFNTHLGLRRRERLLQLDTLLGPEWLGHPQCGRPRLLLGDFNAWPGTSAYRRLRQQLRDAGEPSRLRGPRGTFPSRWPLLRLDHVFHDRDLVVRRAVIPRTSFIRLASDHLPLLVEINLP